LIYEKFDISQVVFRDIFIFYFHLEGEIISILVSFVITYVTIIIEETSWGAAHTTDAFWIDMKINGAFLKFDRIHCFLTRVSPHIR